MTTTIPSGLGATLGVAKETAYGDETTVTRWYLIDANESFQLKKNVDQSAALHGGRFELIKRRVLVTQEATGKFSTDLCTTGLGLLFQNVLGSTASVGAATPGAFGASCQHFIPGVSTQGFSLNLQKGAPETPSGTVFPLSYPGSKITELEITNQVNKIAKLNVSLDCRNEDPGPAYAAPTFPTPNVFAFNGASVAYGGTTTLVGGWITSVSGFLPFTGVVSSISVKIQNTMNIARFNTGASVKNEPIDSNFCKVTGELEMEFANSTDFYTAMAADTTTALQCWWTGPNITGSTPFKVTVTLPNIKWESPASPVASSTDVIRVKVPFTALDDSTNPVIQIDYQSSDSSA